MILSGNSIDHALLAMAAGLVGAPVVPVSAAYSLRCTHKTTIRHIAGLVRPGLVFADDLEAYRDALDAAGPAEVVGPKALAAMADTDPLVAALPSIGPDTVAKILFTSGSTGMPKGVLNTQRMLTANQQQIAQCWPFLATHPPVLLDWLPWSHTFGGNHNFNMVLKHGGSLYIDDGKPVPGLVERTAANLRDVSPTLYFNVPAGFAQLLPLLEADQALAASLFRRLQLIFYAGAALPQDLWRRLELLSERTTGEGVLLTSAWGATETAPMATSTHFVVDRAGIIGVPAPGVTLKLVPNGSRIEVRVKGDNVTPGYVGQDGSEAFDEDGFYRTGDAVKLADPTDPNRGIVFDGRVAEDFKLITGTWVQAGTVRVAAIAASGVIQDAVVAGHDRERIGLLAWLSSDAPPNAPALLQKRLAAYNAEQGGSSRRISAVLILDEPPAIDANEITDKGYINQRAVLDRRAAQVERLFSDDPAVIRIP
jgi:feruloyl-CoA synthase